MSCKIRNCFHNENSYCTCPDIEVDEDGYCKSKRADESHCYVCGAELMKVFEPQDDCRGIYFQDSYWTCPNGCDNLG